MPKPAVPAAFALALAMTAAIPAFAHEFNLLLLAPAGATEAEMQDMRSAFLIASRERDGHADETSEGHLGGIDVQMELARLDQAGGDPATAFVLAPFAPADDPAVAALAAPGNAVVVGTDTLDIVPESVLGAAGGTAAFADRFMAETGRSPGPGAIATYRAARAVDLAVRPLGSVDDRGALRRGLRR